MLIETKIKGNFVPALEFFKQIFKEEEENYFKNIAKAKEENKKENNKKNVSSFC